MKINAQPFKRMLLAYLVKNIALPLLDASVDGDLKRVLPLIYRALDEGMPEMLETATPYTMTKYITNVIEQYTKRDIRIDDLRAVIRLYNPVSAALRNQ